MVGGSGPSTICGVGELMPGWRAPFDIRSSSPMIIQFAMSEEPPCARNGKVRPVSGITRVMPPTTTKTWKARMKPRPPHSSLPNASRMLSPMRIARSARMR